MNKSPKLSVNFSNFLCDLLQEGIAKLKLIEAIPVDDDDCKNKDEGVCHSIIDPKFFLTCKEVQGTLNKQKLNENFRGLIQLLSDVSDELSSNQTFTKLMHHVDKVSDELLKVHFVAKNYRKQKNAAQKMKLILANQKEYDEQKEAKADGELFNQLLLQCKHQLDKDVERKFNESWVEAQVRQNEIELSIAENRANDQLLNVARKTYETDDVYFKVCKFYNTKIKQLHEEINHMSIEYDIQTERVETELQIATNEKRKLKLILQNEHEAFDRREEEMKNYLNMKKKKAEAKKLLELQSVKVVVIQAWWRGTMVRHHFGKFKSFKKRAKAVKKEFQAIKAQRQMKRQKNNRK